MSKKAQKGQPQRKGAMILTAREEKVLCRVVLCCVASCCVALCCVVLRPDMVNFFLTCWNYLVLAL
jgi:hypothetical protein